MTDDTLPTLPRPASLSDHSIAPFVGQYSADQMRTYAAEAVRAALAAQVPRPGITAREVATQVFELCEYIEDQPNGIEESQEVERFKAGQRFAAKRIRNAIGDWLTSAEATAPGASPPPAALAASAQESATTRGGVSRNVGVEPVTPAQEIR